MDDEKIIDPRYTEQLRSLPNSNHDDKLDAMAKVMAGGVTMSDIKILFNGTELTEFDGK